MVGKGVRVGAAAFALGLSLAGPQAAGVAAADTGDADSSSVSAGQPETTGHAAPSAPQPRTAQRGAAARAARSAATAPPAARSAASPKAPSGDAPVRAARAAAPLPRVIKPDIPERLNARDTQSTLSEAVRAEVSPTRQSDSSVLAPMPAAAAGPAVPTPVAAATTSSESRVPQKPRSARDTPKIPALGQALNSVSFSVVRLIDQVGNWLSALPGSPITDVISGGLWLLRRTLIPVGADVGLWGAAACVTAGDCSGQDLRGANLHGQNLAGVSFTGATLRMVDFSTARLTRSDLSDANLVGANLGSAAMDGVSARSANLTGANLTGATLVNADLASANLTDANLARANLTGAAINGIVDSGVNWDETTCPNGSKSSTGCGSIALTESIKPSLIASDWLKVNRDSGEFTGGDEPILVTNVLTTTLGYSGSSKTNVVDTTPNEIDDDVKEGESVGIPNETGDNWINYWEDLDVDNNLVKGFRPLDQFDVSSAALRGVPIPIPVVITLTTALEGDMSLPFVTGDLGNVFVNSKLVTLGQELEATKIYLGSSVDNVTITEGGSGYTTAPTVTFSGGRPKADGEDLGENAEGTATLTNGVVTGVQITNGGLLFTSAPTVTFTGGDGTGATGTAVLKDPRSPQQQVESVLEEAQGRIKAALAPKWTEYASVIGLRVLDWALSISDPDDPVGLGVTVLIPLDADLAGVLRSALKDPATAAKLGLDSSYTRLIDFDSNTSGQQDKDVDEVGFDTNIQVRVGFLLPPESGNNPQRWTTKYAGSWLENKKAEWMVDTQAWGSSR